MADPRAVSRKRFLSKSLASSIERVYVLTRAWTFSAGESGSQVGSQTVGCADLRNGLERENSDPHHDFSAAFGNNGRKNDRS